MSSLSPEDAPLTSQGKPRSRPGGRRRGGSGSGDAAAAEASGSSGSSTAGEDDGSPGSHGENARRMRHVAKRFLGSYYRDINDAPERVARHYTVRRPRRLIAHSNRAPAPAQPSPFVENALDTPPTDRPIHHPFAAHQEDSVLTIEDASTPRATTPVAGAERPGRGRNTRQSQSVKTKTTPPGSSPGYIEIVDFFEGIEPGTSRSPMRALTHSDPTAEGVDAIAQRQRRMFRNRRASVVSVDVRPVPSGNDVPAGGTGSSSRERVMAVVLGNLHATAQGPTDDEADGDVQFMHTFVLERGRRGGDTAGAGDEDFGESSDEQFAIVDEVFRRVDPVGDARAPGGLAAGAASLLRAAQSPPPTRGGLGRRDADDQTGTSDGETSSSFGEKSPKMAKNGQTTADAPEDGGDSPESTKTRKTPNADDLDDSVDEADVWLTNPMYGDVPDTNSVPRDAQTEGHNTQTETPRAVRRAPGSAEVVPESPAINFASPNPFEDEAEGGAGGGVGVPSGVPKRGADPGGARTTSRPMSPDANSIPFPSRSLLGSAPHVHAPRANGHPGSGESRLNRVSRRYSHELEDAGTRRTLFDESPYVNRGRGNRRGYDDDYDDDDYDDDDGDGNRDGDDLGGGNKSVNGGEEGAEGAEGAEQERRARRKERSVAGPPSARYRRRVYSSASSSPAMTSAAPSPGFEPGTSGFDRAGSTDAGGSNASPAAKRGLNARFQYDAQLWASAESQSAAHPGDGVGDRVGAGAVITHAASPSGRVGLPGPRALEPMARSPRLVTLTERSDEGSTAASMRESASVTESAVNSDSERGSTRSGGYTGSVGRGNGATGNVGGVLSDEEDRGSLRAHPVAEDAEILDWEDVRGYPAPNRPNPSAASPDPVPRSSSRVRYNGHDGRSNRGHHTRRSRGDGYGDVGGVDARGSYARRDDTRTRGGPPPVRYGNYRSSTEYDGAGFGDGGYAGVGGYSQPGSRSSSRGSARSSRGFVSRSHAGHTYGFDGYGYDGVGITDSDSFRRSSLSGSIPRGGRSAPPSPSMGATRAREFGVRDRTPRVRLSSAAGGLRGSYRRDDYDFARGGFEFHPARSSAATTPGAFEEEQPPQLEDAVNYLGMLTAALHFTAAVVVFVFLLVAVYANGSAMTSLSKRLDRLDGAIVAGPTSGNLGGVGGWGGGGGGGARMPKVGASVFGGSVVDVSGDAKAAAGAGGGTAGAPASRRSAPKIVDLDSDEL